MAYLTGLVTTAPKHIIPQAVAKEFLMELFTADHRLLNKMSSVFDNAGVDERRSAMPAAWYLRPQNWPSRTKAFLDEGLSNLEVAARRCMELAGHRPEDIDALVFITSSGVGAPSIDIDLIARLGLRQNVVRMPLFGLACAGTVQGLARARDYACSHPGSKVLVLILELCMLSFRTNTADQSAMVASSIFGDGSAALLVESDERETGARILACGEEHWPEHSKITAYTVEEDGFGLLLSRELPSLVRELAGPTLKRFLDSAGIGRDDLDGMSFHPGGPRILENLAESLNMPLTAFDAEQEVLRLFGNMSAPTVLYAFQNRLAQGARGRHLLCAMGAGFTIAAALLDLRNGLLHERLDLSDEAPNVDELIRLVRAA